MKTLRRLAIPAFAASLAFSAAPARAEEAAAKTGDDAYVYKTGRDPFIPLTGQGVWTPAASADSDGSDFKPETVELTGILKTKTGRWAVLRLPNGGSYLVKDGKIFDQKRKAVQGYVGIVKEKTLVIIGPNNQVTELKLKRDLEDTQAQQP